MIKPLHRKTLLRLPIVFYLERTYQLSFLPEKDLLDLCPPIEPYRVTKNPFFLIKTQIDSSRLCVIIFADGTVKCLLDKTFKTILQIFYQYRPRFYTEPRKAIAFCLKPITFVPQQTEKRYILSMTTDQQ